MSRCEVAHTQPTSHELSSLVVLFLAIHPLRRDWNIASPRHCLLFDPNSKIFSVLIMKFIPSLCGCRTCTGSSSAASASTLGSSTSHSTFPLVTSTSACDAGIPSPLPTSPTSQGSSQYSSCSVRLPLLALCPRPPEPSPRLLLRLTWNLFLSFHISLNCPILILLDSSVCRVQKRPSTLIPLACGKIVCVLDKLFL